MRPDLVVRESAFRGEACWLVKNPLSLEYHRLHPAQFRLLSLCDGHRTLDDIRAGFLREYPTQRLTTLELQSLVSEFHRQGLAVADRPGQADTLVQRSKVARRREFWRAARNVLFLRLPGWNAAGVLSLLQPWCGWLFRPWGVVLGASLIVASWLFLAVRSVEMTHDWSRFQQNFGWSNFLWLWVTLGLAKVLHELGHGLCCRELGGECHEIGVAFLVFSPSLYCDVSDAWMLPQKWRRIAIGAAGMYVELLIAAAALAVWGCTRTGTVHFLALNTFCVTTLTTILFNANPLLQYDGYYMMADLLEIPNLRSRSERLLGRFCAHHLLGCESPPDPFSPGGGGGKLALYAAAAGVYRFGLMFSLAFVLHDCLEPWGLGGVGTVWGLSTAGATLGQIGWKTWNLWNQSERNAMQPLRVAVTTLVVTAGLALALLVPLPVRCELPVVVEPREERAVYAQISGELEELNVVPGTRVEMGDVLVQLRNFEQADQLARLQLARETQRIELLVQRKLNQAAGVELAAELLERLETQVVELEQQQQRLTIVAPCAGVVIAPPPRESSGESAGPTRAAWSGTPLDSRNLSAWIETGTHLLSIAPEIGFEARAIIDQSQRNDLNPQSAVTLKFDFRPEHACAGRVREISDRHVESIPQTLSSKFGGPLATQSGPGGPERLPSAAFVALVDFSEPVPGLLPGMRGRARFNIEHRTAAGWVWRLIRTTFQFRL